MRLRCAAAAAALAALCAGPAGADVAPLQPALDYHSFANTEQFRVQRMELDLWVDSAQKVLRGTVGLQIKRLDPGATELILDSRGLQVDEVSEKPQDVLGATSKTDTTWVGRAYHFERADPILGQALVIELGHSKRSTELIRIHYETAPDSPALHWVPAALTAGGSKPFLYTMSAPLGARGWIPLQDSPQVRFTYHATVHTNSDVLAVMTGKNDSDSLRRPAKRNGVYSFTMSDAVPAYALALAVGDLGFKDTGPRTGVYAEKSLLKAADREFADGDALLASAERMLGPYRWERYDVVVLPAVFPLPGVGTPPIAFLSPGAITGDKSMAWTDAQALAHAWAGDLVAHATWRDRWLTEGFSAYFAGRWLSAVYGEANAGLQAASALRAMHDQSLVADLRGRDPAAEATESLAEKGRLFLEFLEARFGRERFDGFLRDYFDHFAFKSVTTAEFQVYLQERLLERFPGTVTRAEVAEWLAAPTLPSTAVRPSDAAFKGVEEVRATLVSGRTPAKKLAVQGWMEQQWIYFLDTMPATATAAQLTDLDRAFDLSRSPDAQIAARWFVLVVRQHYQPGYARLEAFLAADGRNDLIVPIYEELMKSPAGAAQAKRVFTQARPGYQARTAAALDDIVEPAGEAADE